MAAQLPTETKVKLFKTNRDNFYEQFPAADLVLLVGGKEKHRNADTEVEFRQDSDFMYLTGVTNIQDALVILNVSTKETTLFIPDADEQYPVWHGNPRDLAELENTLGIRALHKGDLIAFLKTTTESGPRTLHLLAKVTDVGEPFEPLDGIGIEEESETLREVLNQLRAVKSDYEIKAMAEACRLSCDGHVELMKKCKPGLNESHLESLFKYHTSWNGFQAYPPIVGSGKNSAILHYSENSKQIEDGELVLVDAGCEFLCYAADITRTFPANGVFSDKQKTLYNIVLEAQKELIRMLKPGLPFSTLSACCSQLLVEGLIKAGFITSCTVEEAIERKLHRIFMPHGLGHLVGLDVHDTTIYPKTPLLENMVITIEPGVYFNKFLIDKALADPETKDFLNGPLILEYLDVGGVRIEDVVVVKTTDSQPLVLTSLVPKEVHEIEAIMNSI